MEVQSKVPQNQKMTRPIHCFNSIKSDAAVRSQIGKRAFTRERLATPNDHVSIPGVELDQPHTVRGFIAGAALIRFFKQEHVPLWDTSGDARWQIGGLTLPSQRRDREK